MNQVSPQYRLLFENFQEQEYKRTLAKFVSEALTGICSDCNGIGSHQFCGGADCENCNGTGIVPKVDLESFPAGLLNKCPDCGNDLNYQDPYDTIYPTGGQMHIICQTNAGGCGKEVFGYDVQDCIDKWNKLV